MRVTPASSSAAHTADCVIFGFAEDELRVLLVRRAVAPYAGAWMLPGGAMGAEETLELTAQRVLLEMVGVEDVQLEQVTTYSHPQRHPVRRVVTTSFYALVKPDNHTPVARGYLSDAAWFSLAAVPTLGFDHDRLLADAHRRLMLDVQTRPLAFDLLPDRFTLTEAQRLYENILGEALDRRNFRRKIGGYSFLIDTQEKRPGVKGGPSLYRIDRDLLRKSQNAAAER